MEGNTKGNGLMESSMEKGFTQMPKERKKKVNGMKEKK